MNRYSLLNRTSKEIFVQCKRCKAYRMKRRWSGTVQKEDSTQIALNYFDLHYPTTYRRVWPSIRLALLSDQKYCAVMNNLVDSDMTTYRQKLINECGTSVDLIDFAQTSRVRTITAKSTINQSKMKFADIDQDEEGDLLLPSDSDISARSTAENDPEVWRMDESMWQHIPVSQEYHYFDVGDEKDIGTSVPALSLGAPQGSEPAYEPRILTDTPVFYENLRVLLTPKANINKLQRAAVTSSGLRAWYLMDAASILPVLCLGLAPNDIVLDMCAAPGGKTLIMAQTMLPKVIVCNDSKVSRLGRLRRTLLDFLPESAPIRQNIILKRKDATSLQWDELDKYTKVLVDAPCSTDRLSLLEEDNNIFDKAQDHLRKQLPVLQARMLVNALRSVKVGGTVVYSVCTLGRLQTSDVVEQATAAAFQHYGIESAVRHMDEFEQRLSGIFRFDKFQKYGSQVLPIITSNFGPMYVAKLQRIT